MARRIFSIPSRNRKNKSDIIALQSNRSEDETERFKTVKLLKTREAIFLEAVTDGNMKQVQQLINEGNIDINCSDCTGETGLHIAVSNEMPDMVDLLIRSGAELDNALFQAIIRDSLECVEVLIKSYSISAKKKDGQHFNMTPIVFAAQKGNYEIVKMLLLRGHYISKPHSKFCEIAYCPQIECQQKEKRLENALMRLNSYKALASPVYLCLSYLIHSTEATNSSDVASHDPIYKAIVLKRELEILADEDYEYGYEFKELSRECEEFAVSLLSKCRNLEESASVMDLPGIQTKGVAVKNIKGQYLNVINFAIKNRNKKVRGGT